MAWYVKPSLATVDEFPHVSTFLPRSTEINKVNSESTGYVIVIHPLKDIFDQTVIIPPDKSHINIFPSYDNLLPDLFKVAAMKREHPTRWAPRKKNSTIASYSARPPVPPSPTLDSSNLLSSWC